MLRSRGEKEARGGGGRARRAGLAEADILMDAGARTTTTNNDDGRVNDER